MLDNVIGAFCEQYKLFPNGIRMRDVNDMTEILGHKTRRRLLKIFIESKGLRNDYAQVLAWEICNTYCLYHTKSQ